MRQYNLKELFALRLLLIQDLQQKYRYYKARIKENEVNFGQNLHQSEIKEMREKKANYEADLKMIINLAELQEFTEKDLRDRY